MTTSSFLKERWHLIVAVILIIVGGVSALVVYDTYFDLENTFTGILGFQLGLDTAKKSTYYIGIEEEDYPPLLIYDGKTPTGLDIDLITWIGNEMGFNVTFVSMPWDNVFDALRNGEIDMIMSGASITPERMEEFLFSDPYLSINQAIAVAKNNPLSLHEFYAGRGTIGVEAGTTSETLVFNSFVTSDIVPESMVHTYPGIRMGAEAISKNEIDYLITDWPIMITLAKDYPLKIIGSISTGEEYGIVFRKDNIGLQQIVNIGLEKLLSSPDWESMKSKYFSN